ncbi:MAG: SH3 domain-containing protein [Patescibacteria group bacterium]|jgi:Tfp pilus assembly PilM family ATPase|nr:SH3 domain-containing protein [Patescibacteria group bacterium]
MQLFEKRKLGINISDNSIEILEMSFAASHGVVSNFAKSRIESGIVQNGNIVDKVKLKKIIEGLLGAGIHGKLKKGNIIFGVQEDNLYSHLLTLDLENKNSDKTIAEKLSKKLPKKIEKYQILYKHIHDIENIKGSNKGEVLIYTLALEKTYVNDWDIFFKKMGYNISCFVPKDIALNQTIERNNNNILILSIDFSETGISVFLENQIIYSYKINLDYELFNELDLDTFNDIDIFEKNEKSSLLRNFLYPILSELESSILYIKELTGREIKEIYLFGELTGVKGIDKYLKKEIDDLEFNFILPTKQLKEYKIKPLYCSSLALARGEFNGQDLCFKKRRMTLNIINFSFYKNLGIKKYIFVYLLIILLSFFILSSSYYFYFSNKESDNIVQIEPQKYLYKTTYYYDVHLAADDILRENEIGGRLYKMTFDIPSTKEDILKKAKENLSIESKENEFYWEEPLGDVLNNESLIFPLETDWFIGDKNDLNEIIKKKISDKLKGSVDYEMNIIKEDLIESTAFPTLYKSKIKVEISHNDDIEIYELEDVTKKRALIINTNGKLINIRKGPGTNFSVVAKAVEGETYDFIRELDSWANLILEDGSLVWISDYFVNIID